MLGAGRGKAPEQEPDMVVTLITIGSHGDVQPCAVLGRELTRRGHRVRVAALEGFRDYVEGEGLEYLRIAGEAKEVIARLIGEDVKPLEYFRGLELLLDPVKDEFLRDIERACEGTDLVAYSVLGGVAYHAAQAKGVPCVRMMFVPIDATREFPAMTAPDLGFLPGYNRLTYAAGDLLWSRFTRRRLNGWRESMGLRPVAPFEFPYRRALDGEPVPTLYAVGDAVLRKPSDWGRHIELSGFWFKDEGSGFEPDPALAEFLAAGPKPVYVGFGSMVGGDFGRLLDEVVEGLELAGARAVLSAGWGGLAGRNLPASVHQIGFVPHGWLFGRVAAVVHHGGAGTVAAGLRAGAPTLVVPFGGDQPFWGRRVHELGAGPRPIPVRRFTARAFAAALREAVGDPAMRARAGAIGAALRAEDGPAKAADFLEAAHAASHGRSAGGRARA